MGRMARLQLTRLVPARHARRAAGATAAVVALVAAGGVLHIQGAGASHAVAAALAHCTEGTFLEHEVRWAAACMDLAARGQGDGIADCELPDALAGRLYELLRQGDEACRPRGARLRLAAIAGLRD